MRAYENLYSWWDDDAGWYAPYAIGKLGKWPEDDSSAQVGLQLDWAAAAYLPRIAGLTVVKVR